MTEGREGDGVFASADPSREEQNLRLMEVAKILCGHFSPHLWMAVADDKPELRRLIRQPGSNRDINETTKSDFRAAALDVLIWLRDRNTGLAAGIAKTPAPNPPVES